MPEATPSAFKHPIPVGFKLRAIKGEADVGPNLRTRTTGPDALGEVNAVLHYPDEGWSYRIVFPSSGVCVFLDEKELDDLSRYHPATIDFERFMDWAEECDLIGELSDENCSLGGLSKFLRESVLIAESNYSQPLPSETIFLVQGSLAGEQRIKVCATQEIADHEALAILNCFRADLGLSPVESNVDRDECQNEIFAKSIELTGVSDGEVTIEPHALMIRLLEQEEDDTMHSGMTL